MFVGPGVDGDGIDVADALGTGVAVDAGAGVLVGETVVGAAGGVSVAVAGPGWVGVLDGTPAGIAVAVGVPVAGLFRLENVGVAETVATPPRQSWSWQLPSGWRCWRGTPGAFAPPLQSRTEYPTVGAVGVEPAAILVGPVPALVEVPVAVGVGVAVGVLRPVRSRDSRGQSVHSVDPAGQRCPTSYRVIFAPTARRRPAERNLIVQDPLRIGGEDEAAGLTGNRLEACSRLIPSSVRDDLVLEHRDRRDADSVVGRIVDVKQTSYVMAAIGITRTPLTMLSSIRFEIKTTAKIVVNRLAAMTRMNQPFCCRAPTSSPKSWCIRSRLKALRRRRTAELFRWPLPFPFTRTVVVAVDTVRF